MIIGGMEWIDNGWEKIRKNWEYLSYNNVAVGIVGTAGGRPSGNGRTTIGDVALLNEFGTVRTPARSFLRRALRGPRGHELAEYLAYQSLGPGPMAPHLAYAGHSLANLMRDIITYSAARPNEPSTVRRKGFQHALWETADMRDAIAFELVRYTGGH